MCVREMHCFCAADPLIVSRYAPANRLQLTAGASLKSAQRWLCGWASAAPPRQSAAGSQSLAAFRALLAEKRTKKTPCAPTNRLEFTAGVSFKRVKRRLGVLCPCSAAASCSCLANLDACNCRAETRAKKTRYAPANRQELTAGVP